MTPEQLAELKRLRETVSRNKGKVLGNSEFTQHMRAVQQQLLQLQSHADELIAAMEENAELKQRLAVFTTFVNQLELDWTDELTLIELVETKEYQAARKAAKGK